jgi:hypothetical protein
MRRQHASPLNMQSGQRPCSRAAPELMMLPLLLGIILWCHVKYNCDQNSSLDTTKRAPDPRLASRLRAVDVSHTHSSSVAQQYIAAVALYFNHFKNYLMQGFESGCAL